MIKKFFGQVLRMYFRITCFSGRHVEKVIREFSSEASTSVMYSLERAPTIYGVECIHCKNLRCTLNGMRRPSPYNTDFNRSAKKAKAWLERRSGSKVFGTFIEI